MADLPADRPTLWELQGWGEEAGEGGWDDPGDGARGWLKGVLRAAPDVSCALILLFWSVVLCELVITGLLICLCFDTWPPSSAAEAHPSLATMPPDPPRPRFNFDWAGYNPPVSMDQFSYSGDDDDYEDYVGNDNGGGDAAAAAAPAAGGGGGDDKMGNVEVQMG